MDATKFVPLAIAGFIAAVFYRACYGRGGRQASSGNVVQELIESLFMKRNPAFQMLMTVFTVVIPLSYLAWRGHEIPTAEQAAVFGTFLVSNSAFFRAALMDPGEVTQENFDSECERYPYDAFWYPKDDCDCKYAKGPRPARARWCHVSQRLVSKFDHYCIWLNNAVGRRNYVWFLAFLLTSSVAMTVISLVIYRLLHRKYLEDEEARKAEPEFAQAVSTWIKTFPHAQRTDPVSIWVISLAASGALATGSMFLYHLGLINSGVTTSEAPYYMTNTSPFTQKQYAERGSSPVWPHSRGFLENLMEVVAQ